MWNITQLQLTPTSPKQVFACDGWPILNQDRDSGSGLCRILVGTWGYLDIVASNDSSTSTLTFNGQAYNYTGTASLSLSINESGDFTVEIESSQVSGVITPLPALAGPISDAFQEMLKLKMVPYQNPPSGTPKTPTEIQALADQYFPGDPFGFNKAMALYDWTSASFIRQDLFHQLRYTGLPGQPLDLNTMARVIWGCDYPGYTAKDANFMHAFLMQPATSEQDVYNQLRGTYQQVSPLAAAEMEIQEQAILSLEPVSVSDYPQLYRGAMPMTGGYNTSDFSPSMFEYPGNWGPEDEPLIQSLQDALNGTLEPGRIITTKGPWSFSNDLDGAKVWQNGILITCNPPAGATFWPGSADITAFSLNPGTFEINMPPPSRYRIDSYEWITIQGQPVCSFTMTHLGYCATSIDTGKNAAQKLESI